jgi:hypothetical protein
MFWPQRQYLLLSRQFSNTNVYERILLHQSIHTCKRERAYSCKLTDSVRQLPRSINDHFTTCKNMTNMLLWPPHPSTLILLGLDYSNLPVFHNVPLTKLIQSTKTPLPPPLFYILEPTSVPIYQRFTLTLNLEHTKCHLLHVLGLTEQPQTQKYLPSHAHSPYHTQSQIIPPLSPSPALCLLVIKPLPPWVREPHLVSNPNGKGLFQTL